MEAGQSTKWDCDQTGARQTALFYPWTGKPLVKALVVAVHANFSGVASRDENEI